MNTETWLRSRTPRPPRALTERLEVLLREGAADPTVRPVDALLAACEHLLSELLMREATSRESALDLLAADALMTYAMESAAEDIGTLSARADAAMARLSSALDRAVSPG